MALTRSAKGSVILARGAAPVTAAAAPVAKVVDTTGAGDLYAAGFLYGLTSGRDHRSAAALGSLAAAEVISHVGARPEASLADLARRSGL
jgi:sugar/nucleoside kinase (ribokinase family)